MDETTQDTATIDPTTEVTNVPAAPAETPTAEAPAEAPAAEQAADPAPAAPAAQEPAQADPEPAAAAQPAVADELSTDKELDAFLGLPSYTSPAPAAPYHLIDMEHHVINLIASHLDKVKDEAISEIEKISTLYSNSEVAHYKQEVLAWLRGQ
jgi:hypothetical protein